MSFLIELTKNLKSLKDEKFLLAVSGGLDSMALFHIFCHFQKHFAFNFKVAYFHHGPCEDQQQLDFRFNAYHLVAQECEKQGISFYSNYNQSCIDEFLDSWEKPLKSEAECRRARYQFLENMMTEQACTKLVLAHHSNDLLETRVIRMIRGVGPEGFESMKFHDGNRLRPLLNLNRKDLQSFVAEKNGRWLEDPSNLNETPLRNWIRKKWLKDLEEKNPGGIKSLSRSLDLLVRGTQRQDLSTQCLDGVELILSEYLCLDKEAKKQAIASYMKSQGIKNYGLSHINEVLKRLDTEKKSHTFILLGCRWTVDAGRMSVQRTDRIEPPSSQ